MRHRAKRTVLALLLTVPVCAGCGWSSGMEPPPSPDPAVDWHASPDELDTTRGWGLQARAHSPIQLPEARNGRVDRRSPIPRLTLNLLANGNMVFKGAVWSLGSDEEEERQAALRALQDELTRLCRDPSLRAEDGSTLVPVMLHADREVPWRTVCDLLPILRLPEIRTRRIQWAVFKPVRTFTPRRVSHRLEGSMTAADAGPPTEVAPLVVRLVADASESGARVRLLVAGRIWTLGPQPEQFADEAFLRAANATWADVVDALPAIATGHEAARLEIDDAAADLWFAWVVKTVDLLLGVGIRDVTFPDADLRIRFAEPEALPDAGLEDDPVVTPGILAGCALAVLLAFAVTFLPRVRTRRRP